MDLTPDSYNNEFQTTLTYGFLEGLMLGNPKSKYLQQSQYELSKAYESVLALNCPVKIMPMHFRE